MPAEKFSASKAARLMQCPGSADLSVSIPGWEPPEENRPENSASSRGTRLHEMFANIVTLTSRDAVFMAEALTYVNEVRSRRRYKVLSEHTMTADWMASAPPTTADLVLYLQDEIHIFDLKTGGITVDVVGNRQMLYYAATYRSLAPKARGVNLHIVQPWANNIDEYFATNSMIDVFIEEARKAEEQVLAGSVELLPGDACLFCPANPHSRAPKGKPLCPAMMQVLYPENLNEAEILEDE